MLNERLRLQDLFDNGDITDCIDEGVRVKLIALLPRQLESRNKFRNFELASGPMYDWLEVKRANDHLCSLAMTYGFVNLDQDNRSGEVGLFVKKWIRWFSIW